MQGRKGANSFSVSTHSTTKRITFRTIVLCIFASFWPDGCFADCYSRFLSFWPLLPPPIKNLYLIVVGYPNYYKWTTGCSGKMCFFTIHCNPSFAYIAVREALNAMRMYSHSYWLVIFCTSNSSRVLARERWQTFENSWKKPSKFN